jgi:excisionase family DNA binding protein
MAGQKRLTGMAAGATTKPKRPWNERKGSFMTPEELADEFGITEKLARKLHYDGELRGAYVRSLLRFRIEDVEEYVANLRTEPKPKGAAAKPIRRRATRRHGAS